MVVGGSDALDFYAQRDTHMAILERRNFFIDLLAVPISIIAHFASEVEPSKLYNRKSQPTTSAYSLRCAVPATQKAGENSITTNFQLLPTNVL